MMCRYCTVQQALRREALLKVGGLLHGMRMRVQESRSGGSLQRREIKPLKDLQGPVVLPPSSRARLNLME